MINQLIKNINILLDNVGQMYLILTADKYIGKRYKTVIYIRQSVRAGSTFLQCDPFITVSMYQMQSNTDVSPLSALLLGITVCICRIR